MASWNSIPLEITYQVLGWTACLSWTLCYYPQLISNFCRKSVVGLSFDFVILNLTKHTSYLIHNASLYFSSAIQKQYYKKYGYGQMIPVAANDVAFSIHAVFVTSVILLQIAIYERGGQKVSKITIAIVSVVWLFAAVFMNFARKNTQGFSIGYILLDFCGGVTNLMQMAVQSIDQSSWVNFRGNMGKMLLCLVSITFDIIFMCQHFVLYPHKEPQVSPKSIEESIEPLVLSFDRQESE